MLAPMFKISRLTPHVPRPTPHAPRTPNTTSQSSPHCFLECGIWPGPVGARIHTLLLAFADQPVLLGGQLREREEPGQIVITSLDRLFVHEPVDAYGGLLRAHGQQSCADTMVAT